MKTKYLSLNEFLVWDVYNRNCMYAHYACKEWDNAMSSPERFKYMGSFGDFVADKRYDYWMKWVILN
jgi:hypothetical protein